MGIVSTSVPVYGKADSSCQTPAGEPVSTGLSRNNGWAPLGEAPVIHRPQRGSYVTVIGAIAVQGTRAMRMLQGSVNGEVFKKYLEEDLGRTLRPGDIEVLSIVESDPRSTPRDVRYVIEHEEVLASGEIDLAAIHTAEGVPPKFEHLFH